MRRGIGRCGSPQADVIPEVLAANPESPPSKSQSKCFPRRAFQAANHGGREWQPSDPVRVRLHDFMDETLGKVIPYGVYDLARSTGWVSVRVDHDTPAFAVESIARWWQYLGKKT